MTEIYIIRHAEAEGNAFRRMHGQYNSLLTPRGLLQRDLLQKRFENIHIDACYSSDLTRACLTSRAIYVPKQLKVQRRDGFRERDVGAWEDLCYGELKHRYPADMHNFIHSMEKWNCIGGEDFYEMTDRFINALKEAATANEGKTIAVFAHGAVIKGTLMRLFFWDERNAVPLCDNTGVSRLFYDGDTFTYDYVNDSSHLTAELTTLHQQQWWRSAGKENEVYVRFLPISAISQLPEDLPIPTVNENGRCIVALVEENPVGIFSMGKTEGDTGILSGMTLKSGMQGRQYSDQMLGEVFHYARMDGALKLKALPGTYPDDILERYAFDSVTGVRNIDPNSFDWDDLGW